MAHKLVSMNPDATPQRIVAQVLATTGVVLVIAGIVLAVVVEPILVVVSIAGIADLVMGRVFQSRAERATSVSTTDPSDPATFE